MVTMKVRIASWCCYNHSVIQKKNNRSLAKIVQNELACQEVFLRYLILSCSCFGVIFCHCCSRRNCLQFSMVDGFSPNCLRTNCNFSSSHNILLHVQWIKEMRQIHNNEHVLFLTWLIYTLVFREHVNTMYTEINQRGRKTGLFRWVCILFNSLQEVGYCGMKHCIIRYGKLLWEKLLEDSFFLNSSGLSFARQAAFRSW